jgi:hypothetical protein
MLPGYFVNRKQITALEGYVSFVKNIVYYGTIIRNQKDYKSGPEHYFQEASFMIPTRLRPKYNLWGIYKIRAV